MAHNKMQGSANQDKGRRSEPTIKENTDQWPKEQVTSTGPNNSALAKKLPGARTEEKNFNVVVDGVPYLIRSIPVLFNDEVRFRVIINGDSEHLFTWDSQIKMLRAIDDDASDLPDRVEEAISQKLQSQLK